MEIDLSRFITAEYGGWDAGRDAGEAACREPAQFAAILNDFTILPKLAAAAADAAGFTTAFADDPYRRMFLGTFYYGFYSHAAREFCRPGKAARAAIRATAKRDRDEDRAIARRLAAERDQMAALQGQMAAAAAVPDPGLAALEAGGILPADEPSDEFNQWFWQPAFGEGGEGGEGDNPAPAQPAASEAGAVCTECGEAGVTMFHQCQPAASEAGNH